MHVTFAQSGRTLSAKDFQSLSNILLHALSHSYQQLCLYTFIQKLPSTIILLLHLQCLSLPGFLQDTDDPFAIVIKLRRMD